ncbi:hypothetical protein Tco_0785035, partial [Tanacetum coccineum]
IVYLEDDEGVGAEADMNNLDTFMPVSPIPTTKIYKYHPFEQIIRDLHSAPQTRRMTKTVTEHDLIIKEKMESQSETTQIVFALKLLVLKTRDYDLWSMRMEQYLTHIDYALWEVIVNGDAPAIASASTEGPIPPKTAEQKLARKNELKAKALCC